MHEKTHRRNWLASLTILVSLAIGCNDQVADVAREAADRQAGQNREMAKLQQEVASGSHELVAADAAARQDVLKVHRDLEAERSQLHDDWHELEAGRQQLAAERHTESLLVPTLEAAGMVAVVVMLLGFCWSAIAKIGLAEPSDAELSELLLQEITSAESPLLAIPADLARIQHAGRPRISRDDAPD